MKRSFLATAALVAVLAFTASTATAQVSYIDDDFSTAFGATSPNWSVILLAGNDNGVGNWRYDNIGNRTFTTPLAIPFAMSDSDAAGVTAFTSSLQSPPMDVSASVQVLLELDYMFRQLGATATVEAFDGSTWNNVSTLAENDTGSGTNSHLNFDVTTAMGGATNARLRFVHTANFDWWYGIDNVKLFEPAGVDVACGAITAPVIDPTSCFHTLTATETVTVDYINNGSMPFTLATLVSIDYFFDGVNVLSETDVPGVVAAGATVTYSSVGTVDMSVPGAHTLGVNTTIMGDADTTNDLCVLAYTSPGNLPRPLGYSENFDALPSNAGGFAMTVFDVPAGWENALNDGASLAGNSAPNWGPNNGTTGSNQGPQVDHTTGTAPGIYMYIEDSPSQAGSIELRGPCLDVGAPAIGTPSLQFFHFSHATPGVNDNILDVDLINESTGGTVTMSVFTQGGYGDNDWHVALIDLSSFAPDLIKPQWRTENNNANFTDDVAIDDVLYFDAIVPIGQAPQPGNAVFDINNSTNGLGQNVASGANGPFNATASVGGNVDFTWSGQVNSVMLCLFGAPNDQIATFPAPIGQLDIGTLPLDGAGIPGGLFVFGDGNLFAVSLFHAQFFTGPAGNGGVSFILGPVFPPGFLTRFQCVMNPAGQFFISNAVGLTVL